MNLTQKRSLFMKNSDEKFPHDEWESQKLGATKKYARKVSSEREEAVDDALGLQLVSIRLQKTLINTLKKIALEEGIGYQTYIRQLLTQHVKNAAIPAKKMKEATLPASKATRPKTAHSSHKKTNHNESLPHHGAV